MAYDWTGRRARRIQLVRIFATVTALVLLMASPIVATLLVAK